MANKIFKVGQRVEFPIYGETKKRTVFGTIRYIEEDEVSGEYYWLHIKRDDGIIGWGKNATFLVAVNYSAQNRNVWHKENHEDWDSKDNGVIHDTHR